MSSQSHHGQRAGHPRPPEGPRSTSLPYSFHHSQDHGSFSLVGSSSWPSTESTPPTSVPSRGHQVEKQARQMALSPRQTSNAAFGCEDSMTRGQVKYVNYQGQESIEAISPAQKEFETDPAHAYWKWSVEAENWYHKDEATGAILWAPSQLD